MTDNEIITDYDIIKYLSSIKPESEEQKAKIKKAIEALGGGYDISLIKHFEPLAWDEVEGKTAQFVYDEYVKWCIKNNYKPVSKITVGKYISDTYGLTGKNEMAGGYDINKQGQREYAYKLRRLYRWETD